MRIDHTPALPPLSAPQLSHHHATAGDFPGVGNHVIPKDGYRLLHSESEGSVLTNRETCPTRFGSKVDGFERKGQAWFVATELQSDLVVEVGDMSFHLHKFPLLSRSGKLNRLVFDSRDTENSHIKLDDMPGGPETFELAAKFCYGVAVELTSANVAALRCAAEYLEMTEDLDEGNLVSKTEAFLSFVVLASWRDSVTVLQTCEKLTPWADRLQIVRRCCESISWKACTDPRGIRWSFTERAEAKKTNHASPLWTGSKSQASSITDQVPSDWWFEDICVVCVDFFTKIIQAIKVKGMRHDLIGSAIVHYAMKWLPTLSREFVVLGAKDPKEPTLVDGSFLAFGGHPPHPPGVKDNDVRTTDLALVQDRNRDLIEVLAGILPPQKDAVPCTFLLRLLRLAKMANVKPAMITDLEKRAGLQLDQGTLSDLLIPSFDHTCETLFDVDLVQRMLDYFLLQDFVSSPGTLSPTESEKEKSIINPNVDKTQVPQSTYAAKMRVAKLIDNYLAEVGRDQNLTLYKFLALAEALPEHTRVTDDGLYKAIDTYLKAHPVLSEHDRKKLCRTLDCQRLSLDACMHAAQNERLPLRVVVQVLFGEQIKLRNAVTGSSSLSKEHSGPYPAEDDQISVGASSLDSAPHDNEPEQEPEEIKVLRSDVERMKGKFMALQHDYSAIQQQLEKLTKNPKSNTTATGWKKLFPNAHLPHPHFHVPHFLARSMDLFHNKDHHDKAHKKDNQDGHHQSHDHSQHGQPMKEQDHNHPKEHGSHQVSKEPDSHHGLFYKNEDSHHGHHSKEHDFHHGHISKDHGSHHGHHSKDHDSYHVHHSKDRDSHHGHHVKDHDSHHVHHLRDHHGPIPKDHDSYHHVHHSKDSDSRHQKDPRHRGYHANESDSDHYHSSGHDSQPQSAKDRILYLKDQEHHVLKDYHHSKGHDSHTKDSHRSHQSKEHHDHHHGLPPRDASLASHSRHSDYLSSHSQHSKEHDLPHAKEYYPSNAGQHTQPDPRPLKDRYAAHTIKESEPRHSGSSQPDSGDDSSRSLEGPTTPTHSGEYHKKHARPFANAIRKWRNSIS